MTKLVSIILAAGKGTRMKSNLPKVVHKVGNKPMVNHVLDTVSMIPDNHTIVIIGHQADKVKEATSSYSVAYVLQAEQLGTGHAVQQAIPHLEKSLAETVIVLAGDCPLISTGTLTRLIKLHETSVSVATILSTKIADPAAYGRIIRDKNQAVTGIREARDCTDLELEITEINTGVYCFSRKELIKALDQLGNQNAQKEYYLTDVIEILHAGNARICAYCTPNVNEVMGINTPEEQAMVNAIFDDQACNVINSNV